MRTILTTLLCCIAATPLAAELKYTVRLQTRRVATSAVLDPRLTAFGTKILRAMVPEGPVEVTVIVGDRVARVTWSRALPGLPAGAALVLRKDGSRVLLDTARQVYWRAGMPDLYALPASQRPLVKQVTATATAAELVAGLPATRASLEISIPFPEAINTMMVTGTPTNLLLQSEVWVTDSFPAYATRQVRSIHGLAFMGLEVAPPGKLALRQILRGPLFGGVELESIVIAMTEEDSPDSLFDVPAGFKEVPAPPIRH